MAKNIGFSIANSPLFKTAIAGEDPNWGRIIMAIGKAKIKIDVKKLSIRFGNHKIIEKGELINNYKFWDASLSYRKSEDSKWEFEVKATNLLDTKSQSNSSTSNISISSSEYFIQPRFITFRFIYSL